MTEVKKEKPTGFLFGPNGDRSSKRLGAMFCLVNAAIFAYLAIFYTHSISGMMPLIITWGGYALALWGIAAFSNT